MILQQDVPVRIWGWADAGERVAVQMDDLPPVETRTDSSGSWQITLPPKAADGIAHKISITGNNHLVLENLLFGEVWLGSGQSNMRIPLAKSKGALAALFRAYRPTVRLFRVAKNKAVTPAIDLQEPHSDDLSWEICTPWSARRFSAVLFHFGAYLNEQLDVPIGLIDSGWSGSPIEEWTGGDGSSGSMYNAMIAPLQRFPIRGIIWYQGERNVKENNGFAYFHKMKKLIESWRTAWGSPLPFYFVQLAPWAGKDYRAGQLPALWEAQAASLKIPGTGMVVTTDLVDDIEDQHPGNKEDVGRRLALWALAKTYGQGDIVFSGPLYETMTVEGDRIRVRFTHTGGGIKSRDGQPLTEFEIAGADGRYFPAEAIVEGDSVVVFARAVANPTQVRFGWHNEAQPNLVNSEGLPASPFRTEGWRGGSAAFENGR